MFAYRQGVSAVVCREGGLRVDLGGRWGDDGFEGSLGRPVLFISRFGSQNLE